MEKEMAPGDGTGEEESLGELPDFIRRFFDVNFVFPIQDEVLSRTCVILLDKERHERCR